MNKFIRVFIDGVGLAAGITLVVCFLRSGNHDAAWGWGVASLYIFVELGKSIVEVFDAST